MTARSGFGEPTILTGAVGRQNGRVCTIMSRIRSSRLLIGEKVDASNGTITCSKPTEAFRGCAHMGSHDRVSRRRQRVVVAGSQTIRGVDFAEAFQAAEIPRQCF